MSRGGPFEPQAIPGDGFFGRDPGGDGVIAAFRV
jgi:hypothetical protein